MISSELGVFWSLLVFFFSRNYWDGVIVCDGDGDVYYYMCMVDRSMDGRT